MTNLLQHHLIPLSARKMKIIIIQLIIKLVYFSINVMIHSFLRSVACIQVILIRITLVVR